MTGVDQTNTSKRPNRIIDRLSAVPTAADLAPVIDKLRAGPCHVTLDASQVTELGDAAFQTLAVLHKTQSDRGDRFQLQSPSKAMVDDLARYGHAALCPKEPT